MSEGPYQVLVILQMKIFASRRIFQVGEVCFRLAECTTSMSPLLFWFIKLFHDPLLNQGSFARPAKADRLPAKTRDRQETGASFFVLFEGLHLE